MTGEFDFIAVLKYKTTNEGGRETPAFTRIRPAIKFPFSAYQTTSQQTFINKGIVHPGDTVEAGINILAVDIFRNCLEEGMNFDFREGSRITGTGQITKILNLSLKK